MKQKANVKIQPKMAKIQYKLNERQQLMDRLHPETAEERKKGEEQAAAAAAGTSATAKASKQVVL